MGPWAPCYPVARHYVNRNSTLPPNWNWATGTLDIPVLAPLSETPPPKSLLHVHDNLPQSGTASLIKDSHTYDSPPSPSDIPPPDSVMRSTTPTRRAGSEDNPGLPPKQISLSDFTANPVTSPSALDSRASDRRYLSRPSLPRSGHRDEDGGQSEKGAPEMRGPKYGKSERAAYLSRKGSPKSESKKVRSPRMD